MKELKNKTYEDIITIICFSTMLMIAGVSCNFAVITDNGGKMPVFDSDIENSTTHFSYYNSETINLEYLADKYYINLGDYLWKFSIGDVLIITGLALYFSILLYKFIHFKKEEEGEEDGEGEE